MSDPEVPQPEQKTDVDHVVDSAKAGLAEAEAARGDASSRADRPDAVDPDLAAFEAAEQDHPGTFAAGRAPSDSDPYEPAETREPSPLASDEPVFDETRASTLDETRTSKFDQAGSAADASIADTAYLPAADDAETRLVPSEPIVAETIIATPAHQQPIFVQAPEPPRERGNRATAAGIGLLATLAFAVLYLATAIGLGALSRDVTGENIGQALLAPLTTWGFWVPVVVFFIGFWLLGAIINRGRWGLWVVFGIIVGLFAYFGHILGQLFEAPFWTLTARAGADLVGGELLAPLAIAAFVFGRELTIWFGAWAARSGARKTELNDEAQREYERTLEAGPTLPR